MSDELERDDAAERPRRRRRPTDDETDSQRPSSGGGAKTVIIIISAVALIGFCALGTCVRLFFFGMNRVRTAATAAKEQNDFREIAMAMMSYEAANGHFPPPSMKTRSGKPGLSWRVALLPYLENNNLYTRFRLGEAWDDPANLRLAAEMPPVFGSVDDPSTDHTHIRLFVGKGTIFEPDRVLRQGEISDGMSTTFLFVEAATSVLWIQPDELKFDPAAAPPELGLPSRDFFLAAMADGETRRVHKSIGPAKIKAAITANGNEVVNLDD